MRRLGNTIYVMSEGVRLAKDGETVLIEREDTPPARIPIHGLDGIVAFGRAYLTPALIGFCAERGVTVTFLSENGRFLARVDGPISGNVLLRRAQYGASTAPEATAHLARSIVLGKVFNQRAVLRRALRDHGTKLPEGADSALEQAVDRLGRILRGLERDASLDVVRGLEGEASQVYFGVFSHLVLSDDVQWRFQGRTRRPPRDTVNALLSFVYVLLTHDARSALEGVGLDPQVGFLHRDRPGRPSLALDLVEEFRSWFADRLVLSLINRRQADAAGFETRPGGAVMMADDTRRAVLLAYQERKREEVRHPFTEEKLPVGLLWHVQARLLAAHLRGDLDAYPPFLAR